jgi:hypothetical protein
MGNRFFDRAQSSGRLFCYAQKMKEHNLSEKDMLHFFDALKAGDIGKIQDQFTQLDDQQKRGLLELYVDYNDFVGGNNFHLPMGRAVDLAKTFGYPQLQEYLEEQQTALQANTQARI